MVTPDMFQETTGIWYIKTTVLNYSWEQDVTLNFTLYTSKCLYWDTGRKVWSNAGCRVREKPVQLMPVGHFISLLYFACNLHCSGGRSTQMYYIK